MIHNAAKNGSEVYVCLLSHWSPTRDDDLSEGIRKSHRILGVRKAYIGGFGCMRFKDADHHEIVRFIEACIKDCQPEVLITHHPADIHIDHWVASECCMEAAKLPQRQTVDIPEIRRLMYMEVPSSTDWSISTANGVFVPNLFISVEPEDMAAKIDAVGVYKDVIRSRPHPRCKEALEAAGIVRGSQCGKMYAEAFQLVFGSGV